LKFEAAKKKLEKAQKEGDEMIDADAIGGSMPIFTSELDKMKSKVIKDDDGDADFEDIAMPDGYESSEEEKEDYTIRKTDNLIITATAEDDHSILEVYLFDHKTSDLYVHHEIILGAYPICLEWLNHWQN
jgi:periodic tryptophan protein 1